MNSEALALKNGSFASPAVAGASSVLPVAGAPGSVLPSAHGHRNAGYSLDSSEVHHFVNLGLNFVDASHIVERHPDSLGIDALLLAAAPEETTRPWRRAAS